MARQLISPDSILNPASLIEPPKRAFLFNKFFFKASPTVNPSLMAWTKLLFITQFMGPGLLISGQEARLLNKSIFWPGPKFISKSGSIKASDCARPKVLTP